VPVINRPGVEVRVFSGRSENIEAIPSVSKYVPVTMLDVRLDGSSGGHYNDWISFTQEIPTGDEGFVYVLSGQAYFSSKRTAVSAGQVGHLAHTSANDGRTTLSVLTEKPTHFLLWTGKPIRQPVVARGPFVMNTETQIAEAFEDYRTGKFGIAPA
jgi:redox-sensitive bicupin YhaK (pirin superfamily)